MSRKERERTERRIEDSKRERILAAIRMEYGRKYKLTPGAM
ncbi:hypothetical protein [Thermogymnomonas acidicola]|nr:hypothetical protein [Thermogymnomonas acidicola]